VRREACCTNGSVGGWGLGVMQLLARDVGVVVGWWLVGWVGCACRTSVISQGLTRQQVSSASQASKKHTTVGIDSQSHAEKRPCWPGP
jgi:hypothetical protein